MERPQRLRKWLATILTVAVLVLFVWYIWEHHSLFGYLAHGGLWWAILVGLIFIVMFVPSGLAMGLILRAYGVNAPAWETISIVLTMTTWSCVLPFKGGTGVGAGFFKLKYRLPLTKFFAAAISLYVISFVLYSFFGVVFSVALIQRDWGLFSGLTIFFVAVGLASGVLWWLYGDKEYRRQRVLGWINRLPMLNRLEGVFLSPLENVGISTKVSILVTIGILLRALWYYAGFKAIGLSFNMIAAGLVGIVTDMSLLISITPGNLGLRESIIGMMAVGFGISFKEGLAAALFLRAVSLIVLLGFGPILNFVLWHKLKPPGTQASSELEASLQDGVR